MRSDGMKVGELARRTGLTIRSLHHYDEIGLLSPSLHTESGHRLYTAGDVARLQQILSLRELGFSLQEIRHCLDGPDFSPLRVVQLHLARLREQLDLQQKLCERLEMLAARFGTAANVSVDEFLQTIEMINMQEKYFTPAQLQQMKNAREQFGDDYLRQAQEQWAEVIGLVRDEMNKGTDPADPKVQELARRWMRLLSECTGGDKGMETSLKRLWEEQGDALAAQYGSQYDSRPIWPYITKAVAAVNASA